MIQHIRHSHNSNKSAIWSTNQSESNICEKNRATDIGYDALCCYSNHVYLCNSIAWTNTSFIIGNSCVFNLFGVLIKTIPWRENSILDYFCLFTHKLSTFTIEKLDSININCLFDWTSHAKTSFSFTHLISIDISRKHSLLCFIILIERQVQSYDIRCIC